MDSRTPGSSDLIDRIRFFPFIAAFFLVLLVFDPIQRIALVLNRRWHEAVIRALNRALCRTLRIVGVEPLIKRDAVLTPGQPYILVSNHQSLFDVPMLAAAFESHNPKFIAKKELAKGLPSVSFNLTHGQHAVIDRSNPRQALPEIEKLAAVMAERGFAAVMFPEGTRARTGELKRFLYAGLATLLKAAPTAQVVPVTIDGSWRLAENKWGPIQRNTKIRLIVSEPLPRAEDENLKDLVNGSYEVIERNLGMLRSAPDSTEGFAPLLK